MSLHSTLRAVGNAVPPESPEVLGVDHRSGAIFHSLLP